MLALIAAEARLRRDHPLARYANETEALPRSTVAERLVIARVGQNIFRDALIEYWGGTCAITGLDIVPLLRASHAKPWAACDTDAERLDVHNGFLLAPQWDAVFDGGWVSFDESGRVLVSRQIDHLALSRLGLDAAARLSRIDARHAPYLAYHRRHVFRGEPRG